jgi:hypothetical protein
LVNYKKVRSLGVRFVSLHASLEAERKKSFSKYNRWRFSKKAKGLIVFAIITILLVSVFAWLSVGTQSDPNIVQPIGNDPTAAPSPTSQQTTTPTQTPTGTSDIGRMTNNVIASLIDIFTPNIPPGLIESSQNANSTMWKAVAANAWRYFQPDIGVVRETGLPGANNDFSAFTDWDLGVYIQAVIDANKTGLIGNDGAWGSSARFEKVVGFLETRELNSTNKYPYWFYQAKDGKAFRENSDYATSDVDVIDTGRLFVALNNLRLFNSSLASRINNIVLYGQLYNRSNYAVLVPSIKTECLSSTSIYFYYVASGFASFWPNELSSAHTKILDNIFSTGNTTTPQGVSLPKAAITGDPLLCSLFELNNTNPGRIQTLVNQVYLAHEAYYNSTGNYRAFGEGHSLSTDWVWEWVVLPDGRTWVSLNGMNQDITSSPIIYTKVALGFLAIYNTNFAMNMSVYLERNLPDSMYGFYEGVAESRAPLRVVGCNTNGLILGAALYAIRHYQ